MRAVIVLAQGGRHVQGASTITQQVAKNFLVGNERSVDRKIREALLAFRIEAAYSKDKILELYLNEIYLGLGNYGVAAAALNYFDKSVNELTLAEAAYLAALPKAPNNYHPFRNRERAIERRNYVIDRMVDDGYRDRGRRRRRRRPSRSASIRACFRPTPMSPAISPRKCAASCSSATARRSSMRAACRCARRSIRRCRR